MGNIIKIIILDGKAHLNLLLTSNKKKIGFFFQLIYFVFRDISTFTFGFVMQQKLINVIDEFVENLRVGVRFSSIFDPKYSNFQLM